MDFDFKVLITITTTLIFFSVNNIVTQSSFYDARIQCAGGTSGTANKGTLTYQAATHVFNGNMWVIPSGGSIPTTYSNDNGMKMFYNTSNVLWTAMTEYVAYSYGGWGGHSFFFVNSNAGICPNGAIRIMDLSEYIRCYKQLDMNNNQIINVLKLSLYDPSYNNTKIDLKFSPNGTGSSQDYIQIATNGNAYGGAFGGGITQNVGGFFTLNAANSNAYTEVMRGYKNNLIMNANLQVSPNFYDQPPIQTTVCGAGDLGLKFWLNSYAGGVYNTMCEYVGFGGAGFGGHSFFYCNTGTAPTRILDLSYSSTFYTDLNCSGILTANRIACNSGVKKFYSYNGNFPGSAIVNYFFLTFYGGTITSLSSFYAKITIILCEKSNSNNVQTLVLEVTGGNLYYGQPASNNIVQLSKVSGGNGAYTFGTPTYRPYVITIPTTLASSSGYEYVIDVKMKRGPFDSSCLYQIFNGSSTSTPSSNSAAVTGAILACTFNY